MQVWRICLVAEIVLIRPVKQSQKYLQPHEFESHGGSSMTFAIKKGIRMIATED